MALAAVDIQEAHVKPYPVPTDEPADFEQIYRAYAPYVERLVRQYVREKTRAEDLVQETFLRAYRAWAAVDTERSLWPWLRTIAERLCIDAWRVASPVQLVSIDSTPSEAFLSKEEDPSEAFVASMRRDAVNETLLGLEERDRRVLVLKDLHGFRYDEIAEIEGTTLAALRCSLARARRTFREKYLTVARERGLTAALLPIFSPALRRLRGTRRRSIRFVESALHRMSSSSSMEAFVSAGSLQVSNGVLALVFVLGSLGSVAPRPGDLLQTAVQAVSATFDLDTQTDEATAATKGARSPSENAGPASAQAGEASAGPMWRSNGESAGSAGTQDGNAVQIGGQDQPTDDELEPAPLVPVVSGEDPLDPPVDPPVDPGDITEPNENVREPEDAQMLSLASPSSGDGTVFAAGRNRECATQVGCPAVLFKSTDGGASWTRLTASGFDGRQLLLPPTYGAGDDRIFAMSSAGVLQISADGGQTFGPAAIGAPQFYGSADISPEFNSGDPTILIGTQLSLVQYRDDTKTIGLAPYSSIPGSLEPVFAASDLLMVGGRMINEKRAWGSAVFRCEGAVCIGTRFSNDPRTPKLRLAPGFADNGLMYAFTERSLFTSPDGGRTFSQIPTPWVDGDLVDIALAEGGQRLFAAVWTAQTNGVEGLYVSADSGSTWSKLSSPLLAEGASVVRVAGSRVLVGLAGGGIACSSDLGATWGTRC